MNQPTDMHRVDGEPTGLATKCCRFCGEPLRHTFADLGTSPLCQRHVTPAAYDDPEPSWPLHVFVCHRCFLVQLPAYVRRDFIFDNQYAYFSSFSQTWLDHARQYVEQMIPRLGLRAGSRVVEVASNDGYLLQYFRPHRIDVLGIEPTANTAAEAARKGVPTLVKFFGVETANEVRSTHGPADLLLGNNVLAHVPDINDFVAGFKALLAPGGVATLEFPLLMHLIERNYFDTIYHEHFSYLSFTTVREIFARHGLELFDVQHLETHGGSIRIFARHAENTALAVTSAVAELLERERAAGHGDLSHYASFAEKVKETKRKLLEFLIAAKRAGKRIAAYGAPGKGNTLLNYCGIRTDFIDFTVDRSPHKQGNYLPGSRIPICAPERIEQERPDYLLILVWNLREEVMRQMAAVRSWGCKFVVPLPEVKVYD